MQRHHADSCWKSHWKQQRATAGRPCSTQLQPAQPTASRSASWPSTCRSGPCRSAQYLWLSLPEKRSVTGCSLPVQAWHSCSNATARRMETCIRVLIPRLPDRCTSSRHPNAMQATATALQCTQQLQRHQGSPSLPPRAARHAAEALQHLAAAVQPVAKQQRGLAPKFAALAHNACWAVDAMAAAPPHQVQPWQNVVLVTSSRENVWVQTCSRVAFACSDSSASCRSPAVQRHCPVICHHMTCLQTATNVCRWRAS
jgi:hypothetical protein